jgi:hypothetical protein
MLFTVLTQPFTPRAIRRFGWGTVLVAGMVLLGVPPDARVDGRPGRHAGAIGGAWPRLRRADRHGQCRARRAGGSRAAGQGHWCLRPSDRRSPAAAVAHRAVGRGDFRLLGRVPHQRVPGVGVPAGPRAGPHDQYAASGQHRALRRGVLQEISGALAAHGTPAGCDFGRRVAHHLHAAHDEQLGTYSTTGGLLVLTRQRR